MSKEDLNLPEWVDNDKSNPIAQELFEVLWGSWETRSLNLWDTSELLNQLLQIASKEVTLLTPKGIALYLAGLLSYKLAKEWVGIVEWEVRYVSPVNNLGSGYSKAYDENIAYSIPAFEWKEGLEKLIGLITKYMEVGDKIYLRHSKGKIVISLIQQTETKEEIKNIVEVSADFEEVRETISTLMGVYEFSYPLASGPLDPIQLVASNVI